MITTISVPAAPGEILDKLTILDIKSERISDEIKLANIRLEQDLLNQIVKQDIPASPHLSALIKTLKTINEELWDIEDDIRDCERNKNFDDQFVKLARAVYHTNDKRCDVKREINQYLGSQIIEEKSYQAY